MIFELSSRVLNVRPAAGKPNPSSDDYQDLEIMVMKVFQDFPGIHLEVDDNEFGVYQLHVEVDTEDVAADAWIEHLKVGVSQLKTVVEGYGLKLTE